MGVIRVPMRGRPVGDRTRSGVRSRYLVEERWTTATALPGKGFAGGFQAIIQFAEENFHPLQCLGVLLQHLAQVLNFVFVRLGHIHAQNLFVSTLA